MELLERTEELEALEEALADVRSSGRGSLVLVAGEAGIGKTTVLEAFRARNERLPLLRGACDPLFTPRPLGPVLEIAAELGADGATPHELVGAMLPKLRTRVATLVVLEDLHWADEATLDVVRLLARRLDSLPVLLAATYRDDSLDRRHPLHLLLGELPPTPRIVRLTLAPLSPAAVATLSGHADAAALHRQTGGNPFFVTEVLATGSVELPPTVREAVLARTARLDDAAQRLLDAVAVVPPRAELDLLQSLVDDYPDGIDECLSSGMLVSTENAVAFRHEIARVAVEESLQPHQRLVLHRRALAALAAASQPDLARIAHHAEAAGDRDALLRYAPDAGERAAKLGAHREAAAHFGRSLRFADELEPERRIQLLERRSYECYVTDQIDAAIDARTRALQEHRRRGDPLREGDTHRWLSRLHWFAGDRAAAERHAQRAIELLEPLGPGPELAMAYSNVAQLKMLEYAHAEAVEWGERAIELAEGLGDDEILVHALNNVGSAQLHDGVGGGDAKLERSLQLALDAGLHEHAARAYTNLASTHLVRREYEPAGRYFEAGLAFCHEHDLDSWWLYMTGWLARMELETGVWDAAESAAETVLRHPRSAPPNKIAPLTVLGLLRARRGDGDAWLVLDEALHLAAATAEVQRLAPVAAARAEALWLDGEDERIEEETTSALEQALRHEVAWSVGELCAWRHRAAVADTVSPAAFAEPFALELSGKAEAAAERWYDLGCPYEAALALASSGAEASLRRSVSELQQLGAARTSARVARLLRERGLRVSAGPRASTRQNPAGLTKRELEVLSLLVEGLRNREIASRLFLSEKTIDHHVSSILRKLEVESRGQAAAEAARLGIGK